VRLFKTRYFQFFFLFIIGQIGFSCNDKNAHPYFNNAELTTTCFEPLENDRLKIIACGHIYPILDDTKRIQEIIDSIDQIKPDIILLGGDIIEYNTDKEWLRLHAFSKKLNYPIYYAPGNHDVNFYKERFSGEMKNIHRATKKYVDNIGYRYKHIQTNLADILIVNSNDSLKYIRAYLTKVKPKLNQETTNIILIHHNLWYGENFDTLKPETTWANPYFERQELVKELEFCDIVISGDWNLSLTKTKVKIKEKEVISVLAGIRTQYDKSFLTSIEINKDTHLIRSIDIEHQ
jgi:hypothetical protein